MTTRRALLRVFGAGTLIAGAWPARGQQPSKIPRRFRIDRLATMRVWLRRAELDAMLTRELQKIAGCEGATLVAGPQITVTNFEQSNWADFTVTPAPGSDAPLVRAVAGGVVSSTRELYNVVD